MPDSERPGGRHGEDLILIGAAAREAGAVALRHFRRDPEVWYKNEDRSPVSTADIEVDTMLRERLRAARPAYGWLSEETADSPERLSRDTLFVVDPIDGTRAFLAGKTVWCVSIAVVHAGRPVAGVLFAPATGEFYEGCDGAPSRRNGRAIRAAGPAGGSPPPTFAAPDRLFDRLAPDFRAGVERVRSAPSLAYRLAMVAEGRLAATLIRADAKDWDLAAADVILEGAGGRLCTPQGWRVDYNRPVPAHGVLMAGGALLPALSAAYSGSHAAGGPDGGDPASTAGERPKTRH